MTIAMTHINMELSGSPLRCSAWLWLEKELDKAHKIAYSRARARN